LHQSPMNQRAVL